MPTLVSALTLVALLKMSHVFMPRWHLAAWYAGVIALALAGSMPFSQLVMNVAGSFLAAWFYFVLLDRTDNVMDRAVHWLVLVVGFVGLIASRFYVDIKVYGVGL